MFTSDRIFTVTALRKRFPQVVRTLKKDGMPVLVTQKSGNPLVLADARQFEDLIRFRYEAISAGFPGYIYHSEPEGDF